MVVTEARDRAGQGLHLAKQPHLCGFVLGCCLLRGRLPVKKHAEIARPANAQTDMCLSPTLSDRLNMMCILMYPHAVTHET